MKNLILRTDRLGKRYGRIQAVKEASFTIPRGAITIFLGENGAGKTTTLKILLGFLKPDRGRFQLQTRRIGYVPEQPVFFHWLKGEEVLRLTAQFFGLRWADVDESAKRYGPTLGFDTGLLPRRVETYSSGNKKKFSYLQSLILSPELLIIDEPFSALDPVSIKSIRDLFLKLRKEGVTLFLSSHMIAEVQKICDEFIIIRKGTIVFQDDLRRLKENYLLVSLGRADLGSEEVSAWSPSWRKKEDVVELLLFRNLRAPFLHFLEEKKLTAEFGEIDLERIFLFFA
jgi:ABC-2 type transport system ATP-binding protein